MNTVPYTNARRAGRTHPGLLEDGGVELAMARASWGWKIPKHKRGKKKGQKR